VREQHKRLLKKAVKQVNYFTKSLMKIEEVVSKSEGII